jgi:hypothetical protein
MSRYSWKNACLIFFHEPKSIRPTGRCPHELRQVLMEYIYVPAVQIWSYQLLQSVEISVGKNS